MALQTKTFSVGNFTKGGITNGYILDLIVTEESTSVEKNTSLVSYTLQLRSGGSNRFTSSYFNCKVKVGDQQKTANPKITAAYNHTYTLITGTVTVSHAADGSFELPCSASMWNSSANDYAPYDASISDTLTLTVIPRANTIKATDANIGAVSTVTVKQNSTQFTHSIAYKFGALTGYLDANGDPVSKEAKLTAVSIPFTVPESFYAQIPNAPTGICTLTCRTYSGSTQIGGGQTAQFTVTAAKSACSPSVTGTVVDVNPVTLALTGNEKALVKHRSTARCTVTAQAKNSASITKKTVAGTVITEDTVDIPNMQTDSIEFKVVDSRGYSGTDRDEAVTVVDYIPLTNLASVSRDDPTSGNATVTLSGSYWDGNFGIANNSLTVTYRVNGGELITAEPELTFANGKYSGTVALTALDYTKAHTVEVAVTDALSEITKTLSVQKGIPVFDWGENDFNFHCEVKLNDTSLLDVIYPVGSIYMSVNGVSPAVFFGGTWERIENRFLLAAGSSYQPGSTGGEAAHTLTTEEMPGHSHSENLRAYGYSGWNSYETTSYSVIFPSTDTSMYKSAGFSTNAATVSATVNTGSTGGSGAHNNMPPYLAVYIWKRIK